MPESVIELTSRPANDEPTIDLTGIGLDIPDGGGILWVTEVGGDQRVFNGSWVDAHQLEHVFDGDVYIRIGRSGDDRVEAELLLAHNGKMRPGGRWIGLDAGWAEVLLDPANTLMGVHIDLEEGIQCQGSVPSGDPV